MPKPVDSHEPLPLLPSVVAHHQNINQTAGATKRARFERLPHHVEAPLARRQLQFVLIRPTPPAEDRVEGQTGFGVRPCKSQGGAVLEKTRVRCQVAGFKRSNAMSLLIDDLSRIIASPIPRRQALRLAGSLMGGGILGYLGLGRTSSGLARPSRPCASDEVPCGKTCCQPFYMCCGGTCYGPGFKEHSVCCGSGLCSKASQQCCTDHCCQKTETCCGASCCAPGHACCQGKCCPPGYVCCKDKCMPRRPSQSNPCSA